MFKSKTKKTKTPVKKNPIISVKSSTKSEANLSEKQINQALPIIIERFASALKALKSGQSIRFGKLGSFKKTKREVNGYTGYQYSFKAFSLVKK